jgi:hypothetical protein
MKKFVVPMLVVLSPLISNAKGELVLNCRQPQDGVEINVCTAAQAPSCEKAAATGVQLIHQIRTGKKVIISNVKVIQKDAQYEVGFTYEHNGLMLESMYQNNVFVSARPGGCAVAVIRN